MSVTCCRQTSGRDFYDNRDNNDNGKNGHNGYNRDNKNSFALTKDQPERLSPSRDRLRVSRFVQSGWSLVTILVYIIYSDEKLRTPDLK